MELDKTMETGFSNISLQNFQTISILWKTRGPIFPVLDCGQHVQSFNNKINEVTTLANKLEKWELQKRHVIGQFLISFNTYFQIFPTLQILVNKNTFIRITFSSLLLSLLLQSIICKLVNSKNQTFCCGFIINKFTHTLQ